MPLHGRESSTMSRSQCVQCGNNVTRTVKSHDVNSRWSAWTPASAAHTMKPKRRRFAKLCRCSTQIPVRLPKEIRLCLSSQRKQPVPHKHPYERSRQAKASRHGQKHLSGGDIYFGGPFIVLGTHEKCVREHKRLIHDSAISMQIQPAKIMNADPAGSCAWPCIMPSTSLRPTWAQGSGESNAVRKR